MRIVLISDTHAQHRKLQVPRGDMLIHAGDICHRGKSLEVIEDFNAWLKTQSHQYKIVIAGNHDRPFEKYPEQATSLIPEAIYLEDSGIQINGIRIWGSPVSPWFLNMAFNRSRGASIRRHWNEIPFGTDILITHTPPRGIMDKTRLGFNAGCKDLLKAVKEVKPKLHVFGHIHEAYGKYQEGETTFINASMMNKKYVLANEPQVIDL